jgi:type IV pilus assembly protein PilQ
MRNADRRPQSDRPGSHRGARHGVAAAARPGWRWRVRPWLAGALGLGLLLGERPVSGVEEIPGIGGPPPGPAGPGTPAAPAAATQAPAPAATPSRITTSNPRVDATRAEGGSAGGRGELSPAANAANALGALRGGRRRYIGRRIDLDFKGADIHNILRLLSDVGQVNIVTADDVKGEVTIKMRNVPWDQALDVILRSKLLGQVREGNLIRVAPLAVLEKELEQEIARQKQLADVMPTETRIVAVSYAEAKNLQERAKDLLTPRGRISVDERTNQLIVSDVAANLSLVEDLVRSLDSQTSQVVIEARIVEARSTFVRQLGVQWGGSAFRDAAHGNATGLVFPSDVAAAGGASTGLGSTTNPGGLVNLAPAASPDFAVNLPATVGAGSGGALGLMLGSVGGAFNLNLRLSAMENTGQVRILSSPRISTMDNIEASIEQGVSIPISIISAQGIQTVFVDAKLNLTVKPHVTNEGTIIMNVHVTRNEPDFVNTGARGDPTILKKEAKTVMLVRDGDTAVIGGIYQRNSGLSYAKVPFLADLPIVGFFFRNRRENDDRTEFLVFITPRIANRGEGTPRSERADIGAVPLR